MEQSDALLDEHDAQFLCGVKYGTVILATGGSSDVFHTRS